MNWFKSYFSKRKQYTQCENTKSSEEYLEYGVIQGSSLGPALFSCYISSFTHLNLHGKPFLFADDIAIIYAEDNYVNLESNINIDMAVIFKWMNLHKLTVNSSKSKLLLIKPKGRKLSIQYNNNLIEQVKKYKYLGLTFDEELTWNEQVNQVISKAAKIAGLFKKLQRRIPSDIKTSIFHSLFYSTITYGIGIWGNTFAKNIDKLQRLQNKAIKNLYGLHHRTATNTIHKNNKILKLKDYRNLIQLIHMHNIKNNQIKSNTQILLNSDVHQYGTRNSDNLRYEASHNLRGLESILQTGSQLYNNLDSSCKQMSSLKLKKKIKDQIIESY